MLWREREREVKNKSSITYLNIVIHFLKYSRDKFSIAYFLRESCLPCGLSYSLGDRLFRRWLAFLYLKGQVTQNAALQSAEWSLQFSGVHKVIRKPLQERFRKLQFFCLVTAVKQRPDFLLHLLGYLQEQIQELSDFSNRWFQIWHFGIFKSWLVVISF